VIVLFALLVPVIFAIGSIVMSVGNWYVLKRHLQTQVDAAALAGGPAFTGCFQDPSTTNDNIRNQALEYAGDTLRDPTPAEIYNPQLEQAGDQRVVINSIDYWSGGNTDGTGYDDELDTDADGDGSPCNERFLDVKVTDDKAPLLFRWIPLFPSPKARARVQISRIESTTGLRPIAVPEVDLEQVAVVFVNEDGPNNAGAVRGAAHLTEQTTPPSGLEGMNVWLKDNITPVALNGNNNFGVIVVASRRPATSPISLTGTISQICNQDPATTRCYSGDTLTSGLSFIHAYSMSPGGTVGAPRVRDVSLAGGCAEDLSAPYFNLTGGCPIGITATIDFGMSASSMVNPANHPTAPGICARVTASPFGPLQWVGTSPEGWSMWGNALWTPAEAPPGGRDVVALSGSTDNNGNCGGNRGTGGTFSGGEFNNVAKPYVANDASGPVQYLKVETSGGGLANSRVKDSAASLDVVVGLTPLLRDRLLTDPPLLLRIGEMPNSMTLRCDGAPNQGKPGWEEMMRKGCAAHQPYDASKHPQGECAPRITPDDCVDSKPGNFSQGIPRELWGQPSTPECLDTPNNWDGVDLPDPDDPRWIPLFIVDDEAGDQPKDKTFPIRRFGMFYVTAATDLGCDGDDPPAPYSGSKRRIWGHFSTYVTPGLGVTIPKDELCSLIDGELCVSNLVE
jgi:hypothetical protein